MPPLDRIRRQGLLLGSAAPPGMGEVERNEWEERKTAFPEGAPPIAEQPGTRGTDQQIARLAGAIASGLSQVRIQEPLQTEDRPATTLVWNNFNDVGWDPVAAAPIIQRVDSDSRGRVFFWCFSIGAPLSVIWLTPGSGVQAAFGALVGSGIPLNPPSAVGVFDGTAWSVAIGDDIDFYASSGAAGARLVVVEGVRAHA